MDPLNITLPPPSYYKLYGMCSVSPCKHRRRRSRSSAATRAAAAAAKGGTHPPPPPVVTGEYSVFGAIENASVRQSRGSTDVVCASLTLPRPWHIRHGSLAVWQRAANISHGGSLATFGAAEKFKKRVLEDGTVEIDYETELHTCVAAGLRRPFRER